eukprot:6212938-Prymnesium_polylepis.1
MCLASIRYAIAHEPSKCSERSVCVWTTRGESHASNIARRPRVRLAFAHLGNVKSTSARAPSASSGRSTLST